MYLARLKRKNRPYFQIRRSVAAAGRASLVSQTLFHLGADPGQFIVYPGGNAFYISEEVEDALLRHGVSFSPSELENLFWPFVDPEIRFKLGPFMHRGGPEKEKSKVSAAQLDAIKQFDKRRLYYLRCAHMDQSDLCNITDKLFTPLVGKCRDELEQYFMGLERTLREGELKGYVFSIFDLQRYFPDWMYARTMPETIAGDKLDEAFLQAYCDLDEDAGFWAGEVRKKGMDDYLTRYLIMFFDYSFASRSLEEEFMRNFINSKRRYAPPARKAQVAPEEAEELFGSTLLELQKMSRSALARLFRKRAKEMHPDKGGSHEIFVRLTAVYEELRKRKGQ